MKINEFEFRELHLSLLLISRDLIMEDKLKKEDIKNIRLGTEVIAKKMQTMMLESELNSNKSEDLKLEVNIKQLDEYKELFELLIDNFDKLPKEIQLKIDELNT